MDSELTPQDQAPLTKAVFFIEGDLAGDAFQAHIIAINGAPYLVANWLEEIATGKRVPDELIPLAMLPHVVQQDGLVRLGTLIPRELLSSPIPQRLRLAYGVVSFPALSHIQIRGDTH
jgi:hypothetical protein